MESIRAHYFCLGLFIGCLIFSTILRLRGIIYMGIWEYAIIIIPIIFLVVRRVIIISKYIKAAMELREEFIKMHDKRR